MAEATYAPVSNRAGSRLRLFFAEGYTDTGLAFYNAFAVAEVYM
ncbi:hypothetical protein Lpp225_2205 [Lacticaseibacillus paracasei subsp. paracasei Lpp225]|uniref:Uncharacterized protein n=1 Tax=Lacticaseibacillus paracasei subsp. paracasei Lpp225 TaxID=1256225 RepID=S2N7U9_LACPA|nr:hypothetical protein Lpp225_2205 [Lacticaseibacillus paracasei subsp. paracasei Lpp225]